MSVMPHDPSPDDSSVARHAREVAALASRLAEHHGLTSGELAAALHDVGKMHPSFLPPVESDPPAREEKSNVRPLGRARKVSVSMPEELTAAVQERVGRGEFSQYVTDAVTTQLQLDLLAELLDLLEEEHGPVPEDLKEKFKAEARAAWPDVE